MEFQDILHIHAARYPLMAPQDYGKLAYQSEFGPAHMTSEQSLPQLLAEWEALPTDLANQPPEDIGNGLCRFHLTGACALEAAAPLLMDLIRLTARAHSGSSAGLAKRLDCLMALNVPGMEAWLAEYRVRCYPPVHHSMAFRSAYRPHYRVLRADCAGFFHALLEIRQLLQRGRPAVIAVDGRCGSGKSGFGALIAQVFSCNLFHMDDFYLPFHARPSSWREIPAGNMDLLRFRQEVLLPTRSGNAVAYRRFDCQAGRLLAPLQIPARQLTVVEGSYSHHPLLSPYYDLKLFLTCSKSVQRRRLQKREGSHFQAFENLWMPLEERYFRQYGTGTDGALVVDTSDFF